MLRRTLLKKVTMAGSFLPFHDCLFAQEAWDFSLAFGSCNRQSTDQNHFDSIARERPDLWLWLGDTVYADHASPSERAAIYSQFKSNPYYQSLVKSTPISGIYDDHDYAHDNAGGGYANKFQSSQAFLTFLGEPPNSPLWQQQGLYRSFEMSKNGINLGFVILDTRYFKEANTLLGDVQWNWLETTLKTLSARVDVLILVSSINVNSPIVGGGIEGFSTQPREKSRLLQMLRNCDSEVVILSGDRHHADLVKVDLGGGKEIFEFMSSGLTHFANLPMPGFPNHLIRPIKEKNVGFIKFKKTSDPLNLVQMTFELRDPLSQRTLGRYSNL